MKSSRMCANIFIADVVQVDPKSWKIKFKITDIIDNMENYPTALPLSNHTFQLYPNDEVMIISTGDIVNNQFYYLPISHYEYVGMRNTNSFIDITKNDIMDSQSPYYYEFYKDSYSRITKNSTKVINSEDVYLNKQNIEFPIPKSLKQNKVNNSLERSPWKVDSESTGTRTVKFTGSDYYYLYGYNKLTYSELLINSSNNDPFSGSHIIYQPNTKSITEYYNSAKEESYYNSIKIKTLINTSMTTKMTTGSSDNLITSSVFDANNSFDFTNKMTSIYGKYILDSFKHIYERSSDSIIIHVTPNNTGRIASLVKETKVTDGIIYEIEKDKTHLKEHINGVCVKVGNTEFIVTSTGVYAYGDLHVEGSLSLINLTITNDLTVLHDLTVNHDLVVKNDTTIGNDLTVGTETNNNTVTLKANLNVTKNSSMTESLTVKKHLTVGESTSSETNLTVYGDLLVKRNCDIKNNLTVDGEAIIKLDSTFKANLTVDRDITCKEDIKCNGNITCDGSLTCNSLTVINPPWPH